MIVITNHMAKTPRKQRTSTSVPRIQEILVDILIRMVSHICRCILVLLGTTTLSNW